MSKNFRKIRGGAAPPPLPGGNPANTTGTNAPATGANAPTTGTNAPTTGTNAPTTGTNAPTTGTNAPTTGTNTPATGTNAPTTGTNAPATGANAPAAGANKPNTGGNTTNTGGNTGNKGGSNNKGILGNIKNLASNAINTVGNKVDNLQNKSKNLGGNLLNKGDNVLDNVKDGKYNKWGFIFVVAISLILIIHFVSYIVSHYYKQMDRSPLLVPHTKNAKHTVIISQDPESINYIPIKRSDNEEGIEFAYSFWSLILDYDYKNGEWKHMFHKGNSSSYPNRAPGVWLHPNENKMRVYMNTFDNILEYVDIDDIPVKKWFCTTIILQNAKNHSDMTKDVDVNEDPSHIMDIYINGNLKKSKLIKSIPRQNNGDLWVNLFGGFSGYISRLQYYSYAPDYKEVEDYLTQGPSEMTAQDTGEMPPYLDDKWWFKN